MFTNDLALFQSTGNRQVTFGKRRSTNQPSTQVRRTSMKTISITLKALSCTIFLLAICSLAQAQASRTWVSGVGDDANPCSRTAPCKTFAGAISKTANFGEIDCIDPGGFGAVTITKSITIDGNGTFASILAAGTSGVIINGAGANVSLRNLSINGVRGSVSPGLTGIRFQQGSVLNVENCVIQNFNNFGIEYSTAANSFLLVKDTIIRNTFAGGINIAPTGGIARVTIDNTRVENCTFGIKASGNSRTMVNRTVVSSNGADAGFLADGSVAEMNVDNSIAAMNTIGVRARNSALIRLSNTSVIDNINQGLLAEFGGQIHSFKQNRLRGNNPDGAFNLSIDPQ
jgi:hypothetical protein